MHSEYIKTYYPLMLVLIWIIWIIKARPPARVSISSLYILSYFAFSQNFFLFYRELHQAIQIFLILKLIDYAIKNYKLPRITKAYFVFFLFILISLLFNVLDQNAKESIINFLVVAGVAICIVTLIRSRDDFDQFMNLVAILSVAVAVSGILESLLSGVKIGIEGLSSNRNYFALFVSIGFCVIYATWGNWKKYAALVILFLAILLSGSRAAFFFIIVLLLMSITVTFEYKKIGAVAVILLGVFYLSDLELRLLDVKDTSGSDAERIIFAEMSYRMAIDNPLTGVGWGRFRSEFSNYKKLFDNPMLANQTVLNLQIQDQRVTHNDFVKILGELGFLAFFTAIGFVIYTAIYMWQNTLYRQAYIVPIWVGVVAFSVTHNNLNAALTWFLLFLPYHPVLIQHRPQSKCSHASGLL